MHWESPMLTNVITFTSSTRQPPMHRYALCVGGRCSQWHTHVMSATTGHHSGI